MLGFTIEKARKYLLCAAKGKKKTLAQCEIDADSLTLNDLRTILGEDDRDKRTLVWGILLNHKKGQSADLNKLLDKIKQLSIEDLRVEFKLDDEDDNLFDYSVVGSPLWFIGARLNRGRIPQAQTPESLILLDHFKEHLEISDLLYDPHRPDKTLIEELLEQTAEEKVRTILLDVVIGRMLIADNPFTLFALFRPSLEPLIAKLRAGQDLTPEDKKLLCSAVRVKQENFTHDLTVLNDIEIEKLEQAESSRFICSRLLQELSIDTIEIFPKFLLLMLMNQVTHTEIVDFLCEKVLAANLPKYRVFQDIFGQKLLSIQHKLKQQIKLVETEENLIGVSMLFLFFTICRETWALKQPNASDLNTMIKIALTLRDMEEGRFFALDLLLELTLFKLKEHGVYDVPLSPEMFNKVKTEAQFNQFIKKQIELHARIQGTKIQTLEAKVQALEANQRLQAEELHTLREMFEKLQLGPSAKAASAPSIAPQPQGLMPPRAYLNQAPGSGKAADATKSDVKKDEKETKDRTYSGAHKFMSA
ncbi:MAG: hypothetical protein JSR17_10450 [Proteobacteria bacterium]|nr:hypothetical protein [Pseudomonadota bacterium]